MSSDTESVIERRVVGAAEAALQEQSYVTAVDVLIGMRWLEPSHVDLWRQGRTEFLEEALSVNPKKLDTALRQFQRWAEQRDLSPIEIEYVARTRDRRPLRYSDTGDNDVERLYRTHWFTRDLPEAKRRRLIEQLSQPPELVVIWATKDWTCAQCGGNGNLLLMEEGGPLCMSCAQLDHLVYLPAGDAALTRRAKKAGGQTAVVVRFSRSRGRYERQGILLEEAALAHAKGERQELKRGDGARSAPVSHRET